MASLNDLVGDRGESEVQTELLRETNDSRYPRNLFLPQFLGGKSPTFDFLVYLLDRRQEPYGPHFFLQVKTTKIASTTSFCNARFGRALVRRGVAMKVPSYLVAADISSSRTCKLYVTGISHDRTMGFATVPVAHELSHARIKFALYDEVNDCFSSSPYTFRSSL